MIFDFEKLSFQIFSSGIYNHKAGYYTVAPRPYAAMSYRLEGTGVFRVGDSEFVSEPGNILFISEGVGYDVEYTDGKSAVIHLCDCNYKGTENIKMQDNEIFRSIFMEMCIGEKLKNFNYMKSQVYGILQLIFDMCTSSESDGVFNKCLSYVNDNYCSASLSIEKICSVGNISAATLRRKFHRYCSMSPKKYITEKRLNKMIKMLMAEEKTISEIARCCGFEDEKYVSKLIRKKFGMTPSEFKKIRI